MKTVDELARVVGGNAIGEAGITIENVASLSDATANEAAFMADAKFDEEARTSRAGCLIVTRAIEGRTCIEVENPKLAFARIAALLLAENKVDGSIHPTAHIADDTRIAETAIIGAQVSIGKRVSIGARTHIGDGVCLADDVGIGADCVIYPRVVVYEKSVIGNRVRLHSGVVIGADGFGFVRDDRTGEYVKFPQIGRVHIEDDVEIGANSCVDRGALGETRIGAGTKIDNLVQVGHNVVIGKRVVIAAQTGISGSCTIEDDCIIGGQVGFGDHARVEQGTIIGSKAGVLPGKIVRGGTVYWGVPVRPLAEYKIINAALGRLPQMRADIERLKKKIDES